MMQQSFIQFFGEASACKMPFDIEVHDTPDIPVTYELIQRLLTKTKRRWCIHIVDGCIVEATVPIMIDDRLASITHRVSLSHLEYNMNAIIAWIIADTARRIGRMSMGMSDDGPGSEEAGETNYAK